MRDEFELSLFERELIKYLRALPFDQQQHVSRYILKLWRETATVPKDERMPRKGDEPRLPVWDMPPDELRKLREKLFNSGDS